MNEKVTHQHLIQFTNVLRSFLGSNFLVMPFAFAQAGVLGAIVILLIVTSITYYCCDLLISIKREHSNSTAPLDTFGKVGGAVMGEWIIYWIDILIIFTQVGFCISYSVFMGTSIIRLFPNISLQISFILVGVCVLPFVLIRDVTNLAYTSALSSILLLLGMCGCITFFDFHWEYTFEYKLIHWDMVIVIFGMCTASFEGIGLVIPVEDSFQGKFESNPYIPMLKIAITLASTVLILFGYGGFLTFGDKSNSVLTVNLPPDSPLGILIGYCFCVAIYFSYPLQMYPAVVTIEKHLHIKFADSKCCITHFYNIGIAIRIFLVCLTMLVGYFVPEYGLIGAVIGSLGSASLTYILPPLFHLKNSKSNSWTWNTIVDIILISFGSLLTTTGTFSSIKEIINTLY